MNCCLPCMGARISLSSYGGISISGGSRFYCYSASLTRSEEKKFFIVSFHGWMIADLSLLSLNAAHENVGSAPKKKPSASLARSLGEREKKDCLRLARFAFVCMLNFQMRTRERKPAKRKPAKAKQASKPPPFSLRASQIYPP